MKKFLLLLFLVPIWSMAQTTVNVTFSVDMNQYLGTYTTVNLNGDFNSWCGGCNPMTDADGDGVYDVTLPLAAGTIRYKFTVDGWTNQEMFAGGEPCTNTNSAGFTDRTITFSADTILSTVCWNSCSACSSNPLSQVDLPITFDDPTVNYTVLPFGGSSTASVVADPAGGTNMVMTMTKTANAPTWAGTTLSTGAGLANPIPFSATANEMTVMVYSPDAGITVRLKAEDSTDPAISVETDATTTVANAWEMLTFDFSSPATGTAAIDYNNTYDKLSIFFNFGVDGATAGAKTYYCDDVMMAAAPPTSGCGDLFFSEYGEGSSQNKYLEIYNGTGADVDLSNYVVRDNFNGNPWSGVFGFPAGTILSDGDVYVLAHEDADPTITAQADTLVQNPFAGGTSYVCAFNGDDVRGLFMIDAATGDTNCIDLIGFYDLVADTTYDPGSGFDVAGVSSATANHTLVRKSSVVGGNTDWVASAGTDTVSSEWIVLASNTWTNVGMHTGTPCQANNPCIISTLPYTEDFEMGFPTCWDTTQNAGSDGFLHGDSASLSSFYLPFPAHTMFMASNDDACNCDMSNDLLRSPQFDLTNYAGQAIDLSFEYFNPQVYDSYGTVWYSMNGGPLVFLDSMPATPSTWSNMTLDVSATAGSDSVVFVFKHDDSGPGNWADGVAIDDVTVDLAPNPCIITSLPYTEDFEMGFPTCWDTTQNAGSDGFLHGDSASLSSFYLPFPDHTMFMASNDDACNCDMSNDLLRSPQFDLSGYAGQGLLLSFEYFNPQVYDSYGTVWYSMNGGALTFLDSMPATPSAWSSMTLDVSATAGSDSVVFVFKHDDSGPGNWADGVAIDDVSVDVGALTSSVTFQVDMNAYGSTFGYVNFSSSINGWCGDCAQMSDADGDGVWDITIPDVPNGPIEWKYSLDNWATDEALTPGDPCVITTGGFTNRYLDVQGDTTMPVVCYASCSTCPANPINVNITFQVDMDGYQGGTFPSVHINGTFNGWCGDCGNTMTDANNDNVYEITVPFTNIIPGDTIEWKYTIDGWTDQENLTDGDPCTLTTIDGGNTFINRMLELPAMDMTMPVVCWNECGACSIGLDEETAAFSMFPNPTKEQVTLTWTTAQERMISIIDAQGRIVQVFTTSANELEATLDVNGLTAGWYTVSVESASEYHVEKLIIQE